MISIHALLAESDVNVSTNSAGFNIISIHALLAESDKPPLIASANPPYFYPRSPCGERRLELFLYYQDNRFLSTLSLRRATHWYHMSKNAAIDFYPRSPCGERPPAGYHGRADRPHFYPRSPCGERLDDLQVPASVSKISIHALLAESDNWPRVIVSPTLYFYPRSPCGERPQHN